MPEMMRLLCLANSRKLSGRCIAGKQMVAGAHGEMTWIRPVSRRPHQEVSERERQYQDGSDPRVLDVMDVPLLEHQPHEYQQENWLLDPDQDWRRAGTAAWGLAARAVDPVEDLWIPDHHTYHGRNDAIPESAASTLKTSLRLVHVQKLDLRVFQPGQAFGDPKRRVQGLFDHAGKNYRLWVTDPLYERRLLAEPDGTYPVGESLLTISLGEAYEGNVYKLVAAIIEGPQPTGQAAT